MASAGYFYKGHIQLAPVLNLFCYMTEFPHTLTSTQKLTRLYRAIVRREKDWNFHQTRSDYQDYFEHLYRARRDFEQIWDLPESSAKWGLTVKHYEDRCLAGMDSTEVVHDARQFSMNNNRHYVYNNEQLSWDPYGYYSKSRIISKNLPGQGFIFYPDFPFSTQNMIIDPPTDYTEDADRQSYTNS